MTGAAIVFGLLLVAGALFVLPPLLGREVLAAPGREWERQRAELETRRDEVLAALKEADLDRQTGKLDEADHAAVRETLTAEAAEVLRQLDELGPRNAAADAPGPPAASPADPGLGPPGE